MDCTDFVDEFPTYLAALKTAGALPDYVENIPESSDLTSLPNVAFADVARRRFPIYDKAATFMSAVDAFVKGATTENSAFVPNLRRAAMIHGIAEDVKKAHAVLAAPVEKAAGAEDRVRQYCLHIVEDPQQPPVAYYPVGNAAEVELSAAKMATDLADGKLPLAWFAEAAVELCKAAAAFQVDRRIIHPGLLRLGVARTPSRQDLDLAIEARAALVPPAALDIYKEAAESALSGELPATEGALVFQVADRRFGIHEKFSGLNDPLWAFRGGRTEEEVEEFKRAHVLVGEAMVPKVLLDAVPPEKVACLLNPRDADLVLEAQAKDDGLAASAALHQLSPSGLSKISSLLLQTA